MILILSQVPQAALMSNFTSSTSQTVQVLGTQKFSDIFSRAHTHTDFSPIPHYTRQTFD